MKTVPFSVEKHFLRRLWSFLANTIWGAVTAFFPLYAISYGVSNPGLFFTAYAIVMILGRILGGKILDLYSRDKVMFPCLVTYIVAMIIFAFSKTLPMFILVAVIWGMGSAFLGPALAAYTVDLAGSLPRAGHGDLLGSHRPRNRSGSYDHGRHPPFDQLFDDVPLSGSHWDDQSSLFLFFREKKRITF